MSQNHFWILPFPLLHNNYNNQYPIYPYPYQTSAYAAPFENNQLVASSQQIVRPDSNNPVTRKQRRHFKRRTETQLNKCFKCPYNNCFRSYASDLALNLHMKNKHRGGSKRDRDRVARLIIKAEMEGRPLPKFDIQLPPRYIELNQVRLLLLQTQDEYEESAVKKEQ